MAEDQDQALSVVRHRPDQLDRDGDVYAAVVTNDPERDTTVLELDDGETIELNTTELRAAIAPAPQERRAA